MACLWSGNCRDLINIEINHNKRSAYWNVQLIMGSASSQGGQLKKLVVYYLSRNSELTKNYSRKKLMVVIVYELIIGELTFISAWKFYLTSLILNKNMTFDKGKQKWSKNRTYFQNFQQKKTKQNEGVRNQIASQEKIRLNSLFKPIVFKLSDNKTKHII